MRRLIAYITLAISILIAVGVSATPVLTKLNTGREFSYGKEIVFQLDDEDVKEGAVEEVAEEMRTRLSNFQIEDYSIKVQGDDTVVASFAVEKSQFNYVARYLTFSGEDFAISAADEATLKKNVFKTDEARIVYEQDTIPVVVIPVTDSGKTDIKNIIEAIGKKEEESGGETTKLIKKLAADEHDHDHDHEGEGEEGGETTTPDMYFWANYEEGDSYELASKDPLVREKILMSFYSGSIWYEKSDEEETEIAFICGSADENNQYDLSGLKDANAMANFLLNMLQAKKYSYSISCPTRNVSESGVDYYENATDVAPSAESLVTLGSNINIRMSTTLIATLVAFVIVSLLLVVYYKLTALGVVATTTGTLFLTLLAMKGMGVLFNIPAVVGLIILTGGILLGEIVYLSRFKSEVYKGRSIKKANQEASKKSNLITLDASVIMLFAGLMMYVLGGSALKPLGVVLFFGGVFALLANLLIFKLLMYLVTNSTNLQDQYGVFNIDKEKVPSIASGNEVKESTSPAEKVDFTKKKRLAGIVLGALVLGAISVITVFGVKDGSPLNVKNATKDTTVIYVQLKADNPIIEGEETFKTYIMNEVKSDDKTKVEAKSVEMKKVSTFEYHAEGNETTEALYFITKVDKGYTEDQRSYITSSIEAAFDATGVETSRVVESIEVNNSKELVYTPDQRYVALATAVAIAGFGLYASLRFRPSRGISAMLISAGATTVGYGLMVATRVGTTAVTSLCMPIVALATMLGSLFYLTTEKALRKEYHEELTREARDSICIKALAKSAVPMLVFSLISVYIVINYFGFGLTQTAFLFGGALFGELAGIAGILVLEGPFARILENLFSKISLPKIKAFERKEKNNAPQKRNSSEPEETIFIGIND